MAAEASECCSGHGKNATHTHEHTPCREVEAGRRGQRREPICDVKHAPVRGAPYILRDVALRVNERGHLAEKKQPNKPKAWTRVLTYHIIYWYY